MRTDTRTAVLDAAEGLIQARGANGISYQHISQVVKIRKASIHYHFHTKERLIEAVIRRYRLRFLEEVDRIIASSTSAPTKLRKYTDLFEATLRGGSGLKVCLCGVLGAELTTLGSPAAIEIRQFYRENAERLTRILEEGRRARTLRFPGNGEAVGTVVFAFLEGAMLVARAAGGARQFRRVRNAMLKLFGA